MHRQPVRQTDANTEKRLGRVDKAHPAMDCGELHEAEETFGGLVVAAGDAAKLFLEAHHALDAISPGIAATVQRAGRFAVRLPQDNGVNAAQIQVRAQAVGARILCRREARAAGPRQARAGPTRRRCRRSGRASGARPAAIHSHQTGRESWSRPRHGIGPRHSNEYPFSGPGVVLVRPLSRMPACAAGQRDHGAVDHLDRPIPGAACSNRRHDFLIEPCVAPACKPAPHSVPFGEAFRQGEPVRAIQKMPSKTCRLSIAGRQARPRIGGRNGASSAHVASSMRFRSKAGSQFPALNHDHGAMGIRFVHTA
jgi:hypothetical protein